MFDRDDASREEMREIIGEFSVKKGPKKDGALIENLRNRRENNGHDESN